MELDDLKTMWQEHESGLAKKTKLNDRVLDRIESQRVRSTIRPLLIQNIVVMIFHLLAIICLLIFLFFNFSALPYAGSALVLLGYYFFLAVNTGRQIKEIKSVGKSSDVIGMQTALTRLKTHKLEFIRLSVLTIPVFLSFPVVVAKALADLNIDVFNGFDIIRQTNGAWWLAEIIACVILIPLGIWFYRQVQPRNMHKKWVHDVINRATGKKVQRAVQYLNELEATKSNG